MSRPVRSVCAFRGRRMQCAAALAALVLHGTALRAQGGDSTDARVPRGLRGQVTDSLGRPLFAALIVVSATDSSRKADTVRTARDGGFAVPRLPPGAYTVVARRIGYREVAQSVSVRDSVAVRVRLTLREAPPVLDTVRARVDHHACINNTLDGFLCRRQAGIGYFRDAHELAALNPEQLLDVVRGLPGIRPRNGRAPGGHMEEVPGVRPSRCLLTLVNGRPEIAPRRWWTAKDVVAVEYYDHWSKVPLDYRQIADNVSCDLIVYWLVTAPTGR